MLSLQASAGLQEVPQFVDNANFGSGRNRNKLSDVYGSLIYAAPTL